MSWFFFFVYFFILIFFIKSINLENYKIINHQILYIIFILKICVGISLNIFYLEYYQDRKSADIYKYFDDSKYIHQSLNADPIGFIQLITGFNDHDPRLNIYTDSTLNWKYQTSKFSNLTHSSRVTFSNNRTITKFNAVLRIFSFGNINIHVLFMAFISLIGCLMIFKAYYHFITVDNQIYFLQIIFITPSILIWSSGLLKEGLIVYGFGLFIYSLFNIANNYIKNITALAISIFIIFITKYYLVFILIPIGFIYLIPFRSNKLILIKYMFFVICFLLIFNYSDRLNDKIYTKLETKRFEQIRNSIGGYYYLQFNDNNIYRIVRFENRLIQNQIKNNSEESDFIRAKAGLNYQVFNGNLINDSLITNAQYKYYFLDHFHKAGSYYSLPKLGNSFTELSKAIIIAVYNVFSKPFNFFKGPLISKLASLENLAVLIFIVFLFIKRRIKVANLNVLLFNTFFIITLFSVIGLTIPVIGSLIRYKMIGFLLFLISLSMIFKKKELVKNNLM